MSFAQVEPIGQAARLTAEELEGDLIRPDHPLFGVVWVNPDRMSGAPCFAGSRVPIESLFHYLEAGDSVETFLDSFPPITRTQVVALLEWSHSRVQRELARP